MSGKTYTWRQKGENGFYAQVFFIQDPSAQKGDTNQADKKTLKRFLLASTFLFFIFYNKICFV